MERKFNEVTSLRAPTPQGGCSAEGRSNLVFKADGFIATLLAMTILIIVLSSFAFAAQSEAQDTETSSASLEMIAERMKSLSGSLGSIPAPPQLNQVIQIPEGFGAAENLEQSERNKETKK